MPCDTGNEDCIPFSLVGGKDLALRVVADDARVEEAAQVEALAAEV